MAQRVITERSNGLGPAKDTEKLLLAAFEESASTVDKLRVMWTLHSSGMASSAFLESQLRHHDEHIRVWAIRLLTDKWRLDTPDSNRPVNAMESTTEIALAKQLCQIAKEEHSGLVRLALATALQRLPIEWRAGLASSLVSHPEDAEDHNLPLIVWYGLIPVAKFRAIDLLEVEQASRWPKVRKYIARRFAEDAESNPGPLNALIESSALSGNEERIESAVEGMSEGLKGWRKAPKPPSWDILLTKAGRMSGSILRDQLLDLSVLFGDGRALDEVNRIALDQNADLGARKSALMTLIESRPPNLRETCELLLSTRFLNAVAAKGLALFDDAKIGEKLVRAYSSFHLTDRPQLVSIIVSRASFIPPLLSAIESNKFPRTILSAFDVRQIRNLKDPDLDRRLNAVWGELRETNADKSSTIASFKAQLGPDVVSVADRSRGRVLFQTFCGPCHMMYGEGGKVGPDLTGSGRDNLEYLLENIVDPSAVVPADFRMTSIKMKDGRTLTGMIQERSAKTLAIQLMTERSVIERDEIERLEESPQSLMPEGLLEAMTPAQRRDLIGYLIQKTQAPMPAQTSER
jgi:putative heme-binding domain-containing protein